MVQTRGVDGVIEDDAALLHATREGDAEAYGRLYERHAGAALVVARQYVDSAADAEDVVHEAFANVHRALLGGGGPEVAFRAYLFTAVRRTATVHRTAGRRAEPTDDLATLEAGAGAVEAAEEPALETFERGIVARAFRSLPERWQAVLWHSEVEGLTPAQIGPILGLSANSTAALAYRAREGLRQAYLQHHLQDPLDEGCRAVSGRLGAHVRGGLGARDTAQVEAHLDGCGECRALVLELGDVNHGMRAVVAPLVLGLAGLGALAHELPVGGGLAAGAASLGAGGQGAAGGGAGASGGAGGGAAAGTAA
ncbi:sigma-70 family RNA polymerase sigma factor, partial [Cellulomonas oligotrophica]